MVCLVVCVKAKAVRTRLVHGDRLEERSMEMFEASFVDVEIDIVTMF